jgi:hypothetical protein
MQNPWILLPETAPFVLAQDVPTIEAYNRNPRRKDIHKIHLEEALPEPYAGNLEAPVILLCGNPGLSAHNQAALLHNTAYVSASRANRLHEGMRYPFYYLDPQFAGTPGYDWWNKKLRPLLEHCGRDAVARNLCVVEYFPYHSIKFGRPPCVPSQAYSWHLVREGLARRALVVYMRNVRLWQDAVPELAGYEHACIVRSPQNPALSHTNCREWFPDICAVLAQTQTVLSP